MAKSNSSTHLSLQRFRGSRCKDVTSGSLPAVYWTWTKWAEMRSVGMGRTGEHGKKLSWKSLKAPRREKKKTLEKFGLEPNGTELPSRSKALRCYRLSQIPIYKNRCFIGEFQTQPFNWLRLLVAVKKASARWESLTEQLTGNWNPDAKKKKAKKI